MSEKLNIAKWTSGLTCCQTNTNFSLGDDQINKAYVNTLYVNRLFNYAIMADGMVGYKRIVEMHFVGQNLACVEGILPAD